jgi:hypothetical protein
MSMDHQSIESILEEGRIGEMPFGVYLRDIGAATDIPVMAEALAELGVTKVRWEQSQVAPGEWRVWKSYLVVTLPTDSASPALPPDLIYTLACELRNPYTYIVKGSELWVPYLVEVNESTRQRMRILTG